MLKRTKIDVLAFVRDFIESYEIKLFLFIPPKKHFFGNFYDFTDFHKGVSQRCGSGFLPNSTRLEYLLVEPLDKVSSNSVHTSQRYSHSKKEKEKKKRMSIFM